LVKNKVDGREHDVPNRFFVAPFFAGNNLGNPGTSPLRQVAVITYILGIIGLFWLNRDSKIRTSKMLLLPVGWLLIAGSRNIGEWLELGTPVDRGDAYLEGNPIDRSILAVLVAIGVIVLIYRRRRVAELLRANKPVLFYFGFCALSISWSDYPYVGFKRWIRAIGDLVMVLIVLSDAEWLTARKRLLAWAGFLLLPISILLIRYFPDIGRMYGQYDLHVYWTGVGSTKNELGMICMIFGLASLSRCLDAFRKKDDENRTRILIAHSAVLAMAVYLLHMANSATSLSCFILGGGILLVTSLPAATRRISVVHLMVGAMLFLSFSSLFLNFGSGLVTDLGRNSTLTGRTDVWSHVLKVANSPILGAGYENFWIGPRLAEMAAFTGGLNQAHNGYIEVYLNLGLVGLAILAIVIITGYRNIIAALRQDPDSTRLRLAYFVAALVYSFTESGFKMRSPVWIVFLLAVMATRTAVRESRPRVYRAVPSTRQRIVTPRVPVLQQAGRLDV
jgi:exopolysaccharide production protein ExoQ